MGTGGELPRGEQRPELVQSVAEKLFPHVSDVMAVAQRLGTVAVQQRIGRAVLSECVLAVDEPERGVSEGRGASAGAAGQLGGQGNVLLTGEKQLTTGGPQRIQS